MVLCPQCLWEVERQYQNGFSCLAMLWVRFRTCCVWLVKPRPEKKKKKRLAGFLSIYSGRQTLSLAKTRMVRNSPNIERQFRVNNQKKLQMFPTGRKHLVFYTDLSHSVILSDFEKYSKLVCWPPFPSVVKNTHLGNFFKKKKVKILTSKSHSIFVFFKYTLLCWNITMDQVFL